MHGGTSDFIPKALISVAALGFLGCLGLFVTSTAAAQTTPQVHAPERIGRFERDMSIKRARKLCRTRQEEAGVSNSHVILCTGKFTHETGQKWDLAQLSFLGGKLVRAVLFLPLASNNEERLSVGFNKMVRRLVRKYGNPLEYKKGCAFPLGGCQLKGASALWQLGRGWEVPDRDAAELRLRLEAVSFDELPFEQEKADVAWHPTLILDYAWYEWFEFAAKHNAEDGI